MSRHGHVRPVTADKTHTLCGDTAVYVPKWHGVALATEAGMAGRQGGSSCHQPGRGAGGH